MRKKNSIAEFSGERSSLLLENFRASLARQSQISAMKAFKDAADAPAPRFWVTEARATAVIKKMLSGTDLTETMREEKAGMYREIYNRVLKLREKEPDTPIGDLVFRVVNQPAPSSYLKPYTVKKIIAKMRKI